MTLNSYRDPSLRDRRSFFARHPLAAALSGVVGVFLLVLPLAVYAGRGGRVVVQTGGLPGAAIDAAAVVAAESAATTSAGHVTVTGALTDPPTSEVSVTGPVTSAGRVTRSTPSTTVRRKSVAAAAMSVPATRTAASATGAPRTAVATTATSPPTTARPTTAPKPTTTGVSTTTTTRPPAVYSAAQSEAIIRERWPDDLEEQAVVVATRESSLRNTARNDCCYGLFQINFSVHQAWLATLGVARAEQLYDPVVNADVALALYQRSGWTPWGG